MTRTGTTLLNVQAAGQTALAGQVRDENDKPLAGVTIKLGGSTPTTLGTTDAAGNFLVNLSVAGSQVFLIDGSTASTNTLSYPTIPVTLNVQAEVVNSLHYVGLKQLAGDPYTAVLSASKPERGRVEGALTPSRTG